MTEKGELISKIKDKYSKNQLSKICKDLKIKLPEGAGKKEIVKKLESLKKDELESILEGKKKEKKSEEKVIEISLKPNKWMIPVIAFAALIIVLVLINQPATSNNNNSTSQSLLTFIVDGSCSTCYDVTINEEILTQQYGITLTTKTVDIRSDEGVALINKYQISKIPAFILTGSSLSSNTNLMSVWNSVGTVETDGALVFRSPEVISDAYMELSNGVFKMYVPPKTTLGSFMIMNESVCTENNKPVVYFFGSASCPHCAWEKPLIENVTSLFNDSIIYHENIDSQTDIDVFQKYLTYNKGGVPFIVIGCRFIRVGSGEAAVTDVNTTSVLNLTNPEVVASSLKLYDQALIYQELAINAYSANDSSYTVYATNYTNLLKEASIELEKLVLKNLICNVTSNAPSIC